MEGLLPHFNGCQMLLVRQQNAMHAMMQTRMQKVEKFFVFFSTKLGLLQSYDQIVHDSYMLIYVLAYSPICVVTLAK